MAEAVYDVEVRDRTRRGFSDAEKRGRGFVGRMNNAFSKIKVPTLVGAAAAGVAVGALASKVGDFLDRADQIDKASKRTGLGALAIQRLGFAAEQSGTSFEVVEKGVTRMAAALDDAQFSDKSPSARALAALGLSLKDLEGLTTEEKFARIAGALGQVADDGQQAALAQDIFGRAGAELIPLFEEGEAGIKALGDEFVSLGNVMSGPAVAAGAAANDAINRVKNAIAGAATAALTALLPALTSAIGFMETTVIPVVRDQVLPVLKAIATGAFELIKVAWEGVLRPALSALQEIFVNGILPAIRESLLPAFRTIYEEAFPRLKEIWESTLKPALEGIMSLFGSGGESEGTDSLTGIVNGVYTVFSRVFNVVGQIVITAVEIVISRINAIITIAKELINFVSAIFSGDWQAAWDAIQAIFDAFVTTIVEQAQSLWDLVSEIFGAFGVDIDGIFLDMWEAIRNGWRAFRDFWIVTIPNGFKSGINFIIAGIEAIPNAFIDGLNAIIRAWNDFSIQTPAVRVLGKTVVPSVNFQTPDIPTVPRVSIPRLQDGGIIPAVPGGQLIVAGEGGQDEIVAPLGPQFERMLTRAFRKALDEWGGMDGARLELVGFDEGVLETYSIGRERGSVD